MLFFCFFWLSLTLNLGTAFRSIPEYSAIAVFLTATGEDSNCCHGIYGSGGGGGGRKGGGWSRIPGGAFAEE